MKNLCAQEDSHRITNRNRRQRKAINKSVERKFFFVLTFIMLLAGLLNKAGIL